MKKVVWYWRLICRWLVEAYLDNTTGLAAQMAYDLVFLLAPGLLLISALLTLFGTDPKTLHAIVALLQGFMPQISQTIIEQQVAAIVVTGTTGKVALLGIPLALYLGINLISTISRTLNHCLGIKEPQKPWWVRWIIALLLLFWFGLTIIFSFNAIVFGERLTRAIEATFHLDVPWLQGLVSWVKYPIIALALTVLALALYLLTPEIHQKVREALPGAVFFSLGWLASTTVFGIYVKDYSRYNEAYLLLASFIVLLTWAWVTSLLLLLGGRFNAVLARKWPTRPGAPSPPGPPPADPAVGAAPGGAGAVVGAAIGVIGAA